MFTGSVPSAGILNGSVQYDEPDAIRYMAIPWANILASGTYRSHLEDTMNNFESKLSTKGLIFSNSLQTEFTSHYHFEHSQ